jgi:hypothetical protein
MEFVCFLYALHFTCKKVHVYLAVPQTTYRSCCILYTLLAGRFKLTSQSLRPPTAVAVYSTLYSQEGSNLPRSPSGHLPQLLYTLHFTGRKVQTYLAVPQATYRSCCILYTLQSNRVHTLYFPFTFLLYHNGCLVSALGLYRDDVWNEAV